MTNSAASTLYRTVGALGLTRAQVRRLLPSWWEPALESRPDGIAELGLHLSRRLSLDFSALLEGKIVPKGAVTNIAFKHQSNVTPEKLSAACFVASSLAQAIIAALPAPYQPLPSSPEELTRLLRQNANGIVGFDALLAVCWSRGIPVIPLPHLPVGVRKMDGAALRVADRAAVVIAKRKSSRAWLSFILAHEMAHLALGHVAAGATIIDVALQDMSTYATESSSDKQERDADTFALEILGGKDVEAAVRAWSSRMSPVELAVEARRAGQALGVEPGHLILRHAFLTKQWSDAVTALNFLSEDLDPESALIGCLRSELDMERVAEDMQDMVTQVTGWGPVQ